MIRRAPLLLLLVAAPAAAQEYRFPIEPPASGTAPYITAYRDLASGASIQDWNCGNNAYNGHRGTDIGIGGFSVMDAGSRWVVAAADGEVTFVVEGCFDRCTSGRCDCGGGFGNYVKITHADGKSTFYGHLMQGTVQVAVGDRITCGTRLGKVGSSGNSTGPHLHFEPRYSNNVSDDPFSGPCGGPVSFWVSQGSYNALPDTTCAGGGTPPPPTTVVKGVVWDDSVTNTPSAPGNVRVPGTVVTVDGVPLTATARPVDAFWELPLEPGSYRLAYAAPGYEPAEQTITVASGETRWASIGLTPENGVPPDRDDAILLFGPMLVEVEPSETFQISFTVQNTGTTTWREADTELVFDEGYDFAVPTMPLGAGEAVAPGAERTWRLTLTASTAEGKFDGAWRMQRNGVTFGPRLEITAIVRPMETEPPPPPPDDPPVEDPPEREPPPELPEIEQKLGTDKITGGCGCSATARHPSSGGALLLLFTAAAFRRRSTCRPSRP